MNNCKCTDTRTRNSATYNTKITSSVSHKKSKNRHKISDRENELDNNKMSKDRQI